MIEKGPVFYLVLTLAIYDALFRVALSFDNPLAVEKACSCSLFQLSDACVCGVQRLSDMDRQRFFAHQGGISTITAQTVGADGKLTQLSHSSGLFPINSDVDDICHDLKEIDILLTQDDKRSKRTVCEKFMGWLYGW
jgi:hypothetical protein